MPELPEVEVLVRHLARVLPGQRILGVEVRRAKSVRPDTPEGFARALEGRLVLAVRRRAKYLVFDLEPAGRSSRRPACGSEAAAPLLLGHLGMTGRMYVVPAAAVGRCPRHAAVVFDLGEHSWVFEDTRYFGRMTLDASVLTKLGPEPLAPEFTAARLASALHGSRQSIKVKLLDQQVVAGVGNIYASEALHQAGIQPRRAAGRLKEVEIERLRDAIRTVLDEAIRFGSTVPLDFSGEGEGRGDGLFYYGAASDAPDSYTERLLVYDRAGQPCAGCATAIRRIVQAGRSTYFCPRCQR